MAYTTDHGITVPVNTPRVLAFNTGRLYTAAGQRIAVQPLFESPEGDLAIVAMVDIDRHIEDTYMVFLPITSRSVMDSYDHDCRCESFMDYEARRGVFEALRAAAGRVVAEY